VSSLFSFESRPARLNYSAEEIYHFVTDIRNLRRFLPQNTVSDLKVEKDSCSFHVSMLGPVIIYISERDKYNKIVFSGNALQVKDFSLIMNLLETENKHSEVRVTLVAEMNPLLKMVAAEPVKQFLETLVNEMEKFSDWGNITEDNRPL